MPPPGGTPWHAAQSAHSGLLASSGPSHVPSGQTESQFVAFVPLAKTANNIAAGFCGASSAHVALSAAADEVSVALAHVARRLPTAATSSARSVLAFAAGTSSAGSTQHDGVTVPPTTSLPLTAPAVAVALAPSGGGQSAVRLAFSLTRITRRREWRRTLSSASVAGSSTSMSGGAPKSDGFGAASIAQLARS